MNLQPDVVKKSYLKFKTAKAKGSPGTSVQALAQKAFKEFWVVFRALETGGKVLEIFINEKKFLESSHTPKGSVPLGYATCIHQYDPDRKQHFSIEMSDGALCLFEAASVNESDEWVYCLNAVLFGVGPHTDGALQYQVDVEDSQLPYNGPSILEVKGDEIVVWTSSTHEQVVRWKLAHIRSFKAKRSTLVIYPGSRSSTGLGTFCFRSSQSIQITHAIETIVRRLKNGQKRGAAPLPSHPPPSASKHLRSPVGSERRPLPALPPSGPPPPSALPPPRARAHLPTPSSVPPPRLRMPSDLANVPNHIPPEHLALGGRTASNIASIPNFRPPEYEDIDGSEPVEDYGRLEHTDSQSTTTVRRTRSQQDAFYSQLNRDTRATPTLSPSPQPSWGQTSSSPALELNGVDYECLDQLQEYGKLDQSNTARASHPTGDGQPSAVKRKIPPPKPVPYRPKSVSPPIQEVYAEIDEAVVGVRPAASTTGYNKLMRRGASPQPPTVPAEGYGVLDHYNSNPELRPSTEHYGALEHFPKSTPPSSVLPPYQPEEYGKLEHPVPHFDPYGSLSQTPRYNKDSQTAAAQMETRYEMSNLEEALPYTETADEQPAGTTGAIGGRSLLRKLPVKQESLPDSEEFYSAISHESYAEDPQRLRPPPPETLYEFCEEEAPPPPPPIPPRKGRDTAEPSDQPECKVVKPSQQKPEVPNKPPLKPKLKPKPRLTTKTD